MYCLWDYIGCEVNTKAYEVAHRARIVRISRDRCGNQDIVEIILTQLAFHTVNVVSGFLTPNCDKWIM